MTCRPDKSGDSDSETRCTVTVMELAPDEPRSIIRLESAVRRSLAQDRPNGTRTGGINDSVVQYGIDTIVQIVTTLER